MALAMQFVIYSSSKPILDNDSTKFARKIQIKDLCQFQSITDLLATF